MEDIPALLAAALADIDITLLGHRNSRFNAAWYERIAEAAIATAPGKELLDLASLGAAVKALEDMEPFIGRVELVPVRWSDEERWWVGIEPPRKRYQRTKRYNGLGPTLGAALAAAKEASDAR